MTVNFLIIKYELGFLFYNPLLDDIAIVFSEEVTRQLLILSRK